MTVKALVWVTERTVAADNQGNPNSAEIPPTTTIMRRSRWKPVPFVSILSFLLQISLTDKHRGMMFWYVSGKANR